MKKGKKVQLRILYPEDAYFRKKGERKTFPDTEMLREIIST